MSHTYGAPSKAGDSSATIVMRFDECGAISATTYHRVGAKRRASFTLLSHHPAQLLLWILRGRKTSERDGGKEGLSFLGTVKRKETPARYLTGVKNGLTGARIGRANEERRRVPTCKCADTDRTVRSARE